MEREKGTRVRYCERGALNCTYKNVVLCVPFPVPICGGYVPWSAGTNFRPFSPKTFSPAMIPSRDNLATKIVNFVNCVPLSLSTFFLGALFFDPLHQNQFYWPATPALPKTSLFFFVPIPVLDPNIRPWLEAC